MATRESRRQRQAWAWVLGLLVAPLVLLVGAPAAQAAETCFMASAEKGCITGTLRTEKDVVADVDVHVTGPGGFDETVTSDEKGKWSVVVTETGDYTAEVVQDTLPEGVGVTGDQGVVKVTVANLSQTRTATFGIRTGDYRSGSEGLGNQLLNGIFGGLRLGLLLALASVGLSLIYGTTGLSNFAHAEQVTLGGILAYALVAGVGLNLWLGSIIAIILCGLSGWIQDLAIWRPLRSQGMGLVQMMIVTIGLSLAMQYTFQFFIGAATVKIVNTIPTAHRLGPITFSNVDLFAMLVSIAVLVAVGYVLLRTRIGRATRAISDNPALASASGIDVDRVIRMVWTVSMALAGLSGILYSLSIQNGITWDSGMQILLLLFAAVTLGGLGTAFGALVGSLIIGWVVTLAPILGAPGDLKYAVALLILILLLLVRPQGLLGRAERVG